MNAAAPAPLPSTWDLSSFFPAMEGREYRDFKAAVADELAASLADASSLAALPAEAKAAEDLDASLAGWERIFLKWEDLGARFAHLLCYIGCLGAANAADEAVQAEEASLELIAAELAKLQSQLLRGLRAAGEGVFGRLLARTALSGAGHTLVRLRAEAAFQMPADLEALAADLGVNGYKAWGRLYETLTGKLSFEMTYPDGRREVTPMAQCRALMANPDRAVRRAAFEGSRPAWQAHLDTCAAVVNSLAGTRHTLYARRGRGHFLDAPLHDAALSRETLDAMFAAVSADYALARRVTALAARLQGTPALSWYDLEAPAPLETVPELTWDEAVSSVQAAFDAAYPRFGEYFRSMVRRRWIESEKRANKRSGAFQTASPVLREERIYMTFSGAMHDVITLSHEAGHAWHTHLLNGQRPCAREYPMTLAETASTFAEKIYIEGLLSAPGVSAARRAFLLDAATNHTPAYLLNIPVRFLFEKRFYELRREGFVGPTQLNALMAAAQREVYGDTLAADGVDPTFWASKLHFSISSVSFYNFPYTFGFLLSQALFAEFQRSGAAFLPKYEAFLRETGSATCEEAVRRTLGWDIRQQSFWAEAIKACQAPIDAYEQLVASR
ncbi:MAG TPA: M3 family metallopeptidase [Opitutaceae bacterium]|nr:M3 family metallopeptidase [Opitutaceae bacterium]